MCRGLLQLVWWFSTSTEFYLSTHVCVPIRKPDGNMGKLLAKAGAKTFHLKRKLHLCALPPQPTVKDRNFTADSLMFVLFSFD